MTIVFKVLQLFLLILCVGFFTSSETAYLSLSKLKVRRMVDEKRPNAKTVSKLKSNMDRLLTTVLIGTNFLNSLTSALATALALILLGDSKFANLTPFITAFFITTFGQIVPKTTASLYPDKIAGFSSKPLRLMEIVFFPIVWLFEKMSGGVVKIAELIMKNPATVITEEELQTLIAVGETEGTIEKDESRMMNRLIKFNDMNVSDVMKHKSFVRMISVAADMNEVVSKFQQYGYSIMPVYKDTPENIVGMIPYEAVLFGQEEANAEQLMQPVEYVPGTFGVIEMLNKFRKEEYRFAVVLNEQGQTMGIITIEDIIRMVFGRMTTEENLYNELPSEERIKFISANTYLVPGEMKITDANELLNLDLVSEDFTTVGGWLLENFGKLPNPGEVFIYDKIIFQVEDVVQRRITSIRVITS